VTDTAEQRPAPISLAVPKGRLLDQVQEHFASRGIHFEFEKRKLVAHDNEGLLKIILVKNSDLPTYVNHGIAGLGICGEDVLYESGKPFFRLATLPFGSTRMCLATREEFEPQETGGKIRVATKFTRFTRDFFHEQGIPVELIRLNGSVELAPILGLAPYIVDLVETGGTLKANNLVVRQELAQIQVKLVANPAFYKYHYRRVRDFVERIGPQKSSERQEEARGA
jgi:ATP phosphoribosyltransferase